MPLPVEIVVPTGSPGSLTTLPGAASLPSSSLGLDSVPLLSGPRGRRRALWRGGAPGRSERPVLLEWFSVPREDLAGRLAEARGRTGLCHINLLRVIDAGPLGPHSGYVVSEAPAGVDLLSVLRVARPRGVPSWWLVAVAAGVGRGLQALHAQGGGIYGGLSPAVIFVGWQGEVQLLAFSALVDDGSGLRREAPELAGALARGGRVFGAAGDVYALAQLLQDLMPPAPEGEDPEKPTAEAELRVVLAQALSPDPGQRPSLTALGAAFSLYLQEAAPQALAQAVGGVLQELYPRESAADQISGELDLTPLPAPPSTRLPRPETSAAPAAGDQGPDEQRPAAPGPPPSLRPAPAGARIRWPYWALAAALLVLALGLLLLEGG